jgi:predicted GNAT family acetyltransferase
VTIPHVLDRPIWHALKSRWSGFAIGTSQACRLDYEFGPFAAAVDASPESAAALMALRGTSGEMWLVEKPDAVLPKINADIRTALLHQMIVEELNPTTIDADIIPLTAKDAVEMRALALLTKPGPFYAYTHLLGDFIGIKQNGQLVAMAGERIKVAGFTEVSAVCTHPDFRGRGYAGALISAVATKILSRSETPFLSSYASNKAANALYETLGFRLRSVMTLTSIAQR